MEIIGLFRLLRLIFVARRAQAAGTTLDPKPFLAIMAAMGVCWLGIQLFMWLAGAY